jgi:hypothetical protein
MANDLERYNYFLREGSRTLNDIKQFLKMVLMYFFDTEVKKGYAKAVSAVSASESSIISLVKSLCLIHGLHGYPADNRGKSY